MEKTSKIGLAIENPRLKELLAEQLTAAGLSVCEAPEPSELVTFTLADKDISLPLRLGDFLDRVCYELSGRDRWTEDETTYDLGVFWLQADENLLLHKDSADEIRLTDKERLLLRALYDAHSQTLPRETLLKAVWGYIEGTETHTLETHLYRLRQKLEPYGAESLIEADGAGNYSLNIPSLRT